MNVANRKLFANRDARKKLAEMGGILASSPELLGEAQKFAEAGQIDVQMYVINVPGLTAPGEYLKVSEETLMQLNDIVPQLMSQQDTLVEPAEAVEGLVDVRPGDALLPKRLRDIGAIPDQAPVPTVQEPVDDRSIRDIVREGLASTYSKSPMEAIIENLTPDSENPMVQMVESGLQSMGVEDPNAAISGPSGVVTGLTPSQKFQSESLNPMNIGPTELNLPAVRNALRDPNAPSAGLASSLQEAAARGPVAPSETQTLSDALSRRPGFRDYSIVTPDAENPMVQMIESGLTSMGVADPSAPVTMSDITGALGFDANKDSLPSTLSGTDFNLDPTQGYPFPMDAPSETSPSTDPMNLINVGPALTTSTTVDEIVEDATERQQGFVPGGPGLAERQAGRFASGQPDPELMQMAGMPDDSDYLNGLTEQIFENPGDVSKFLAVNAEQAKKKREAAKKDDGTTTPPPPDDDKTDKIIKMSTSEATNEYYKSLKELFGLSDEDKARDLSLTMAQFGFAMAAGQSPNALTNIANAAGAALAQMRQTQATEREREDKLKLMAYEQALGEQKEARELDRLLAKENRADKRELALYVSKLQAKAALDPDVKTYLETAEGKAALGIYKDIIGNELIDADEVVSTFLQQAGDLAPGFLTYLGLGAETGGNAGGDATKSPTTLKDVK